MVYISDIYDCRYVSLADIIDLSSLVSNSGVRVIDLRYFVSLWCDIDVNFSCYKDSKVQSALIEKLRQCGSVLSGYSGDINGCLYASDDDCRTTVWTFQNDGEDGALDSFQPDEQLKRKKKIAFVRRRKDVYNTLGPGSKAESSTVLAFGSLFTGLYKGSESYIDIHEAPRDRRIQSMIEKIEFLPFVPEITSAGKEFSLLTIKSPFLCAQLRLLDGQFKNHWKATFLGLKQKLELLRQKGSLPIHIFVMTDLPMSNWTGTFLGDLAADFNSFKLFVLREEDELIRRTAKKILGAGHGMKFRSIPKSFERMEKHCSSQLPDILLHVEETICSCATLGFVGTAGSTIANSIEIMRKNNICSS